MVAPYEDTGDKVHIPLIVAGEHRLDLRLEYRCSFDFTGEYLAIETKFALSLPHLPEPVVRFDYVRSREVDPAHVQLHAE